ncbi:MAG TPA: hypothetical protein VG755_22000 [Nannocystaceae bacterium]|nr:hypothetical protein [Nannocystaceae bacterium]
MLCAALAATSTPAIAAPVARPKAGAKPGVKPRRIDLGTVPPNVLLRTRPVAPNPALSGLMLASLRGFVQGVENPTAVDRAIAKALGRGRKNAAKKLLARIDARPKGEQDKGFGKNPPGASPSVAQLSDAAAHAGMRFAGVGSMGSGMLPDEAVAPPSKFELTMSGLRPVELSDGDADGDELLALTAIVSADGPYVVSTASAPASDVLGGVASTAAIPLALPLYDGASKPSLLVSVVVEVDGDAETARQDFGVVLALAQAHAELLAAPGESALQRLTRFALTLDYTIALLNVANPETWPSGSLQKTMLAGASSFADLYATPASNDGAVPWKIAHDHDLPTGHYKLYFDVPSPERARPRLKVKIAKVEALDGEAGGADMGVIVGIDDATAEKTLPNDKSVVAPAWTVQRKLAPERTTAYVDIAIFDRHRDASNKDLWLGLPCGDWGAEGQYPPCPLQRNGIDLSPVGAWGNSFGGDDGLTANLVVDLVAGTVAPSYMGEPTGPTVKLGEALAVEGTDAGNRGRVTVVVTLDP